MRHWDLLGEAPIPDTGKSLLLYRGKDDFFIKLNAGPELMNSRKHGSEDALGRLPCQRVRPALPSFWLSCSALPIWPIQALHFL